MFFNDKHNNALSIPMLTWASQKEHELLIKQKVLHYSTRTIWLIAIYYTSILTILFIISKKGGAAAISILLSFNKIQFCQYKND